MADANARETVELLVNILIGCGPLVIGLILIRSACQYRKRHAFLWASIGFLLFVVSFLYLEAQSLFLLGDGPLNLLLDVILYMPPNFMILYSVSVLSEKWYRPIQWSLVPSAPAFLVGLGYQTGFLGGGLVDLSPFLFLIPYYLYLLFSFVYIPLKIKSLKRHGNNSNMECKFSMPDQWEDMERMLAPVWLRKITGFLLIVLNVFFWGFMILASVERIMGNFFWGILTVIALPFYLFEKYLSLIILYGIFSAVLITAHLLLRRFTKDCRW